MEWNLKERCRVGGASHAQLLVGSAGSVGSGILPGSGSKLKQAVRVPIEVPLDTEALGNAKEVLEWQVGGFVGQNHS